MYPVVITLDFINPHPLSLFAIERSGFLLLALSCKLKSLKISTAITTRRGGGVPDLRVFGFRVRRQKFCSRVIRMNDQIGSVQVFAKRKDAGLVITGVKGVS
jgi:hypothetical protein